MKKTTQDIIIAGLGIVGLLLIGVAFSFFGINSYFPTWAKITASTGGILCLMWVAYNGAELKKKLSSQSFFTGANTLVFILIVLGVLVLVNYIGVRHNKRWDLTQNKTYSLSPQTLKLLSKLDANLKVTAFYASNDMYRRTAEVLLKEYAYQSAKVQLEFVDPDMNPGKTQDYMAQERNTFLEYKGKKERVTGFEEKDFSSALLKLLNPEQLKVYFLTGHGENDLTNAEAIGYQDIRQALEQQNYIVDQLALTASTTLPNDMAVLVIAGPKSALLPAEETKIKDYLAHGGKAFILLNPQSESLNNLLSGFGIKAETDVIVDPVGGQYSRDPLSPIIQKYPNHDVTRGLAMTIFPFIRSLSLDTNLPPSVTTEVLLESTPISWGETDFKDENMKYDEGKDKQGPLTFGLTWQGKISNDTTGKTPETRLVVIGGSNFGGNNALKIGSNKDFFLNCVSWLTGDSDLLGIRAKDADDRQMDISGAQYRLLGLIILFVMPGLVVLAGVLVWIRKR